MNANLVQVNGEVLIDLTQDTVTADDLPVGVTAHDKTGAQITGTMIVNVCRRGTSVPDSSIGDDGDWYVVVEE